MSELEIKNKLDLTHLVLTPENCQTQIDNLNYSVIEAAVKQIADKNEKTAEQSVILRQQKEIEQLQATNQQLVEALTRISNMCVGDQAMGYPLDSQSIGQLIFEATGMTNPELNKAVTNVEQQGS